MGCVMHYKDAHAKTRVFHVRLSCHFSHVRHVRHAISAIAAQSHVIN